MYNTQFICTYKLIDDIDDHRDNLYRAQFLQAFNIHVYDEKTILNTCYILYEKVKDNNLFKNIIQKSPFYDSNDLIFSFMMLFNYDTFDLLHRCIIEEIDYGGLKESSEFYKGIIHILEK